MCYPRKGETDAPLGGSPDGMMKRGPIAAAVLVGWSLVLPAEEAGSRFGELRRDILMITVRELAAAEHGLAAADELPPAVVRNELDLKRSIEEALYDSPLVNSFEVHVRVDGTVTRLYGAVDTCTERVAARRTAREQGANNVRNLLRARNGPCY